MTPRVLEAMRPALERSAEELTAALAERGEIDGVRDLARPYPLRVFPDAVGLGPGDRENLIRYGSMVFNAFGPRNELFQEAMADADAVRGWIAERCRRDALTPDGLGAQIYAAVDAGEVTEDEAGLLVRSLLSAGVDTTVHSLAWTLHALAAHPDQWALLRSDPSLARSAFEETLRYASPVRTFFRTTTRDVEVAGTKIPAGEKVLLFLGAANRDHRAWPNPDRFDISRHAAAHVAFGSGVHACVGAAIARLEAEVLLTALAERVKTISPTGTPRPRLNNTIRGLATLPLRLRPT